MAKRWLVPGSRSWGRAGITGHARLLAHPAYQKLLAAEPLLRRAIPVLIVIFLAIVGLARFFELYQLKDEREESARQTVGMVATILSAAFAEQGGAQTPSQNAVLNALADTLPPGALADGRRVYITNAAGIVIASAPRMPEHENAPLTDIIGESQPLTTFGARAGVLDIALAGREERALAAAHQLDAPLGFVAVVQPMSGVYQGWRAEVSLNAAIFIGTSAILLVILYGYFAQATRAAEADRIYTETQARFETALARGRCGLWDWDLAKGRLFWSRSMFELVGFAERNALMSYGEVSRLIHPDDGDLMALVESLFASGETNVDRMFRMRHEDGRW
ncbi:MAG: PAS domain-containing protein, partial [Bauldia sp.]